MGQTAAAAATTIPQPSVAHVHCVRVPSVLHRGGTDQCVHRATARVDKFPQCAVVSPPNCYKECH